MNRRLIVGAIVLGLVAFAATAGAATTYTSTFKINTKPTNQDSVSFRVKVISDAAKCVQHRKVKFSERDAGTSDPWVVVDQGFTNENGVIVRDLPTAGT